MDKRPSDVIVAGISQTPVGEFWDQSIRQLGIEAILDARKDAGGLVPEVLYVGNLLAVSPLVRQTWAPCWLRTLVCAG